MILVFASAALAGFGLDRVDLLSADPGTFLADDISRFSDSPTGVSVRWFEQVSVVLDTPAERLHVGLSLASQSLAIEQSLGAWTAWQAGLSTSLGLPRGAFVDVSFRRGAVRVAAAVNLHTGATWSRPQWTSIRVLPAIAVGVGPVPRETAVWMD